MKLAHIVPSLEARHGGPSVSVPGLAGALAAAGASVELLTTGVLPVGTTDQPLLEVHTFPREWPQAVCPSSGLRRHLQRARFDAIHSHGLWLRPLYYAHCRARTLGIPHVISPRGMMGRWAWEHRRSRKLFADRFVHPGALRGAAGWHATSAEESAEIRALGFDQPICVAPNGVQPPAAADWLAARTAWSELVPEALHRRVALFYSRFHAKKRILELIELWARVAPSGWLLLIVGLPEQFEVAQLREHARRCAGRDIRIFDGAGRPAPYALASLFLLPSHNENFGLVVAEALAAGVPVLVSDGTPWQSVETVGAGWCRSWTEFPEALRAATAETPAALAARGAAGAGWVKSEYSWARPARALLEFYRTLAEG